MGSFLYTTYTASDEFHLAFRQLNEEFPSSEPLLFAYTKEDAIPEIISTNRHTELNLKQKHISLWMENEISKRSLNSSSFQVPFHPLPTSVTSQVDNKYKLYEHYKDNEAASVFPKTYKSIHEALESTEENSDPDSLFYVKESEAARSEGIRVFRRDDLQNEPEPVPGTVIIQQAVENLLTIDDANGTGALNGRRFDIRFFVVVHGGRAYFHSNMYGIWPPVERPFDPRDPSIENQLPKQAGYISTGDCTFFPRVNSSWRERRTGESNSQQEETQSGGFNPVAWRDVVAAALDVAKPSLASLLNAAAVDPSSYTFLGGDAMIRRTGEALIVEYNDWPDFDFRYYYDWVIKSCRESDEACRKLRRVVLPDLSEPTGYKLTPPSPPFYWAPET